MSEFMKLMRPEDYQAANRTLFPSMESWRWYCRVNRIELIAAGALLRPTGRWLVDPDAFHKATVAIGLRRAREG